MAKRRGKAIGIIGNREATLFRMLIEDYEGYITLPEGVSNLNSDNFDINERGDVVCYLPTGILKTLLGVRNARSISFLDVCQELKDGIVADPDIKAGENLRKTIDGYLINALQSKDKNLLINRMFSATLAMGEFKDKNNNQNNDDNQKNQNQKQDPPKKDQGNNSKNDGKGDKGFYVVPGATNFKGENVSIILPGTFDNNTLDALRSGRPVEILKGLSKPTGNEEVEITVETKTYHQ